MERASYDDLKTLIVFHYLGLRHPMHPYLPPTAPAAPYPYSMLSGHEQLAAASAAWQHQQAASMYQAVNGIRASSPYLTSAGLSR